MKRIVIVAIVLALLAMPAFSQVRLDIGVIVPRGAGVSGDNGSVGGVLSDWPFIPIPEAGLYYQWDLGLLKLGLGARAESLLLETFLWPNALAEVDIGPVAIEGKFGGGAFLMFGLDNNSATGKVFFPDLSAWFKLGKKGNFRLGGGVVGIYVPDSEFFGNNMIYLLYLAGKASIML
ncbi:MAG TPA: hypothetical protein VMC79_06920 [Rectinemataceae bacterium]|nr:hypothetical protein [Rectinemataceae bacterium]